MQEVVAALDGALGGLVAGAFQVERQLVDVEEGIAGVLQPNAEVRREDFRTIGAGGHGNPPGWVDRWSGGESNP